MSDASRGLASMYLAIFLMSSIGIFAKTIPLDAVSITQLRSAIAALCLLVFNLSFQSNYMMKGWRTGLGVYGLGVLMGLHWITFFHSMQISSVAVGILSLFSYPIITVLLEPVFRGGKPRWQDIVSGCLVLVGIVIMVSGDLGNRDIVEGVLFGIASAFFFSIRNIVQKYKFNHVSSSALMMHQVIAIALVLLVFLDWEGVGSMTRFDWGLLVSLGVVTTAGAHTLVVHSLKALPAKSVAMVSCLQPALASLLAFLLLGEVPTLTIVVGGCIILGVALVESIIYYRE